MTDDLDEFFSKVGTRHKPHRVRVCNRVMSHPGLNPWTCTTLIATDPGIPTLECVHCGHRMVLCDCENADEDMLEICLAENECCRHQQQSGDDIGE